VLSVDADQLATGHVTAPQPGAAIQQIVGCGRPLADHQVVIVDPDTRRPCPPDQIGEIWVAGPSVGMGYWRQPQATEETFHARIVGETGLWLRTGDLGFLHGNSKPHPNPPQVSIRPFGLLNPRIGEGTDRAYRASDDGDPAPPPPWGRLGGGDFIAAPNDDQLFITGRIKDLIIIRGRNVYAQDVERVAVASHPALQENGCAVFGVETPTGEGLTVVAEVRPDQRDVGIDEVAVAVRRAIAQAFNVEQHALGLLRPGHLPRTTSGKIRRAHCRQELQHRALPLLGWKQFTPSAEKEQNMEEETKPQSRLHKQMILAVRLKMGEILGEDPAGLDLNHSIQDLGLGSLQAAALRYELEDTFDVTVPDDLYRQDGTVADFLAALAAWAEGAQGEAGDPS